MAEEYTDILCVGPGAVKASIVPSDYFPLVGDTVTLDGTTRWAQTAEWQTQNGDGTTETETAMLTLQRTSKSISVVAAGELVQILSASNKASSGCSKKTLYAMEAQTLPYFDIDYDHTAQVIRAGSDNGTINLKTENGYSKDLADPGQVSVEIRIYKENWTSDPVVTKSYENDLFTLSSRGIYDVEIDVTDVESGITLSKRVNKLITVIPALCPQPDDLATGYEVAVTYTGWTTYDKSGEKTFEVRLWRDVEGTGLNYAEMYIPSGWYGNSGWTAPLLGTLPAGTTLVLRRDPDEPDQTYPMRLFLSGDIDCSVSAENGTPNFTYDAPLVITHDNPEVWQWPWWYYGAIQFNRNMRNVVLDGYGYHNTGIRFYIPDSSLFVDICLYLVNGSSDIEVYGIDIDGAGFCGISAKTDPRADCPWYWRDSGFEMALSIHHCTFRNTEGEGIYIGYFSTSEQTGTDPDGKPVTYYPHVIRAPKVYRNTFKDTGLDSIQINNAVEVEVCYNRIDGSATLKAQSQASAFSCQMDGTVYNNVVMNCNDNIGVIVPWMTGLELFNNIMEAAQGVRAFTIGANDYGAYYSIHNNLVKAKAISGTADYMSVYTMDDNIFITEDNMTELPVPFTGSGNVFLQADQDYGAIDSVLKVADSENDNYQPAHNSPVVTAGGSSLSGFDLRGYKPWFISHFHAGPYMGKYKDLTLDDSPVMLVSMSFNGGTGVTTTPDVVVSFTYSGTPTRYRIGAISDLSGERWQAWAGDTVVYTLTGGYGTNTVYAQLATNDFEGYVVSGSVIYSMDIIFADPTVEALCLANWDTDSDGVFSIAEAAAVTSLSTVFKGNTEITSFDELKYFTGLTSISNAQFQRCTALTSVTLPDTVTVLQNYAFDNCTSLTTINLDDIAVIGTSAFRNDIKLVGDINMPKLVTMEGGFARTQIESVTSLGKITATPGDAFNGCTNLKYVTLPDTLTAMGTGSFRGCTALEWMVFQCPTPPTIGYNALSTGNSTFLIYVPDDAVETYRTADEWGSYSDRIFGISEK